MKRKLLYLTTIILTLAGCASEDYVGNEDLHEANDNGRPVSFNLSAAPQTRSQRYGGEAASDLNNNFIVWGDKTITNSGSTTTQTVFNNYQVNYVDNSAYTTTSNSAGWEYVGCVNLPYGTKEYVANKTMDEVELNHNGIAYNAAHQPDGGVYQSIKYWDFSANNYNFFAYSLGSGVTTGTGEGATTTYAAASAMTSAGYSLSGSVEELAACYISDRVIKPHAQLNTSNTQVQLQFRKLGAKVRIALYETIPGYSVKDVKFYQYANDPNPGTEAYLFGSSAFKRNAGTYAISFADANSTTPTLGWTAGTGTPDDTKISFGSAVPATGTWTHWADHDYMEPTGEVYIGRSSIQATGPANSVTVLPSATSSPLILKVDYTLLSRDNSNETIEVKGATAIVPAEFASWKSNCSYTYLFKISDNTDGHIGDVQGLYPITLDAVVNVDATGAQETITTVTEPSITTYQNGSDYATTNEYKAYSISGNIYIVVYNSTGGVVTLTDANAKLYTASATPLDDDHPVNITEATVESAISNPSGENKDANGNTLTVAEVGSEATDVLDVTVTEIPGEATPDGNAITVNGAKFAPTAGTTYVFRYTKVAPVDEEQYTQAEADTYNAGLDGALPLSTTTLPAEKVDAYNTAMGTSLSAGAALTESDVKAYNATLTGHKSAGDIKTAAVEAEYQYKVIKVAAP